MSRRGHGRGGHGVSATMTISVVCGVLLGMWTRSFLVPCPSPLSGQGLHHDQHQPHWPSNNHDQVISSIPRQRVNVEIPYVGDQTILSNSRPKQLVLIGVMTAKKYVKTRAVAAYQTWASQVPGKVIFFSSAGSETEAPPGIPVVGLPGVDDSYPPQKKSFMMFKYMHDLYLDEFEYFLRADDDVYINGDKLSEFLRSINSSRTLFIGQAGQGNKDEIGLLNLHGDENFCMGGPSMLLSRSTLASLGPNVGYCLKNLFTTHEDVEIGRCVNKFAGVGCTWAFEMQRLFYNNYKEPNGSFTHSLKTKDVHRAITMHPVKNHTYQYRLHHYFTSRKAASLKHQTLLLHREIHAMNEILQDRDAFYSPNRLGLTPSLLKSVPKSRDEVLAWDYIARHIYSIKSTNPKRGLELSLRKGLEDIVMQVMDIINKNARQRGRTIDFKDILYGYSRVNPLHGADYVLDLLLVYRKHKGKRRMTVPVRRHAYLQQTFTDIEFREEGDTLVSEPTKAPAATQRDSALLGLLHNKINPFYKGEGEEETPVLSRLVAAPSHQVIHFILPLAGRFKTFLQFMHNFEDVCLKQADRVVLAVMLFHSDHEDRTEDTIDFIRTLQVKYPHHDLRVFQIQGPFSRGVALQEGSKLFSLNALLFFIDVDIYLRQDVLQRIRHNAIQGRQVYYPIVFSQYDSKMTCDSGECPQHNTPFNFENNMGYWRQFGFGITALYNSDLKLVGGFDTNILGWGKEDVELYSRFLAKNVTVFRAVDPGLVHVFHPVVCDPNLDSAQYQMCLGTKAATFGSTARLAEFVYHNPEVLYKNEAEAQAEAEAEEDEHGQDMADAESNDDHNNVQLDHL